MKPLSDLLPSTFSLEPGAHDDPLKGMCIMELVAFMAGEKHSDHPQCASPVIGMFVRWLNDHLPNETRQRLLSYWSRIIGSAAPEHEQARSEVFISWAISLLAHHPAERRSFHDWVEKSADSNATEREMRRLVERGCCKVYRLQRSGLGQLPAEHFANVTFDALNVALAIGPSGAAIDVEDRARELCELLAA